MKLVKPLWVNHSGGVISSIDVNPEGTKLCTGGSTGKGGCLCLWNMDPIRNENDISEFEHGRLLSSIEVEANLVNVVRWSPVTGTFLVSGGTDKILTFWKLVKVKNKTYEAESWKPDNILQGHTGDILGIEWSSDESLLASCDSDGNIIIWEPLNSFCIKAVLKGHTNSVRSICWDPAMCYIVSSGYDQSLRFWRISDWKQEVCLRKPFEKGDRQICSLHWSPDGQQIVCAHSIEHQALKAHVIRRRNWESVFAFPGHCKPINVIRFSPKMMRSSGEKGDQPYCCVAFGSNDHSLSVWFTHCKHPILILRDVFAESITEISWSKSGNEILASSHDGSVCYVSLEEKEIGIPILDTELGILIAKNCFDAEQKNSTDGSHLPLTILERSQQGASQRKSKIHFNRLKRKLARIQDMTEAEEMKKQRGSEPIKENKAGNRKKPVLLTCQIPDTDLLLEARNASDVLQNESFCILRCFDTEKNIEIWHNILEENASKLIANSCFISVACEDCSIHLFSVKAGSMLHSPFVIPNTIATLRCWEWFLLVLSSDYLCYVWHIRPPQINNIMNGVSIPKRRDSSLIQISFLNTGVPALLYSDLRLYIFNLEGNIWTKFEAPYPQCVNLLTSSSESGGQTISDIASNLKTAPNFIENFITDENTSGMEEITRVLLFGILESHIISSVTLDMPSDFETWLLLTLRFLTKFDDNLSLSQMRILLSFFANERTSNFIKDNPSLEKLRSKIRDILSNENFHDATESFTSFFSIFTD